MFEKWHDQLFGGIEKIDIHYQASHPFLAQSPQAWRSTLEHHYKLATHPVTINITPDAKGTNFALVHYSQGLLRPAHVDVVVMAS